MSKKQILFVALTAISVSLIVWGCNKAKPAPGGTDRAQAMKTISKSGVFPCDMPTVENGILTFTDTTQYLCYEKFLTDVTENNKDTSMSEDDQLAFIENVLGFRSLRAEKLAAFEAMNARGWATSEEIPDEDWIYSRIRRSMLNTNREVRIGNYIEKHVSPEYIVTVDATQPGLLTALRRLPEHVAVEDIIALDPIRAYIFISSMKHVDEYYPTGAKPTGTGPGGGINPGQQPLTAGWRMNGSTFESNRCNEPGLISFGGFTTNRNWVPQKCVYHIDYGDGTASGTATDPDKISAFGTNQSIVGGFKHQYAQGNYTATVSVRAISPINSGNTVVITKTYPITIGPPPITCTPDFQYKQSLVHINNNTDLKGAIRFETWHTIFNQPRTRVSGWTELHQQNASGYWNRVKNKKTQLYVKIGWNVADKDCKDLGNNGSVLGSYSGENDRTGRNTNRKEVESSLPASQGEVLSIKQLYGTHTFWIDNGISGSFNHYITICQ